MLRRSQIKALILLFIFSLIMLKAQLSTGSGQKSESGNARPAITSLDLESFRSRLETRDQAPANGESPELSPAATPLPADILVVANGTIIVGDGADPIPHALVVIRGNRLAAVGRATDVAIPAGAKVIDVAGQTIMPGIINAHVHYACDPAGRRRFLVDGVTAVCDLGSDLRCLHNFEREVDWQNQPVARGFKAGPIITVPGGYPSLFPGISWHYEVATPAEAEAAVNDLLDRGVDVIKIALEPGRPQQPWPVLTPEQVERITTAAHARGALVQAHARQAAMLDIALQAGVDVIEHAPLPFCLEAEYERMLEEEALHLTKQPELAAQLARMAEQGVVLAPTLEVATRAIHDLPGLEPEEQQRLDNFLFEIVARFRTLGGLVALGNDYGNPGVQSGMPLPEMKLLLAAGLTPLEVIEAGTRHAAYVSGHGHELGTLEPSKLADLIVVHGDPLADIEAMSNVVIVIKAGQIVYWVEPT